MGSRNTSVQPVVMVIFGASGDLTRRKLIPALHSLVCEGLMPSDLHVIGIARTPLSNDEFRNHLYEGMEEYSRLHSDHCEEWPGFTRRLSYFAGQYDDPQTYRHLTERLQALDNEVNMGCNRLYYLATPPMLYADIVEQLGHAALNRSESGWTRIIVEKPFGRDLTSARRLNAQIHAIFDEDQVYRIDHYLGKETVQNILTFRFANTIFEPLWNRNYVDHVQISMTENMGVGHRAGYYEEAGVIRDMVQNHLIQLLTLTAMEPPVAFNAKSMRDEKVKVLQAIQPIPMSDGVWGQYLRYRDEPGVVSDSHTPTYVALKIHVDNWRWQGVPFYLRSGKSLARKSTEITLQFKTVPHLFFQEDADVAPNRLSLRIQPDEGMHLQFETKIPGMWMQSEPVDMDFRYDERFGTHALPDAYERLLLDAVQGDASLFARSDEIERSWSLITPLLEAWESQKDPALAFYEHGSWGPAEADTFMSQDGRAWIQGCGGHD